MLKIKYKHNWRDYISSNNPVAAALLSKMGYQKQERVQVKLEFLRMLIHMQLDPARMTLLTGFFETYLALNAAEERKLEEEMGKIEAKEAKMMLEITTSWEEKGKIQGKLEGKTEGRREGIAEGQASILIRQLKKKFGDMNIEIEDDVRKMPAERLQELAEAIFELETIEDVKPFL